MESQKQTETASMGANPNQNQENAGVYQGNEEVVRTPQSPVENKDEKGELAEEKPAQPAPTESGETGENQEEQQP